VESVEPDSLLKPIGIDRDDLRNAHIRRGKGCEKCQGTGFKGRTGLYELLVVDETIRQMTSARASAGVMKSYASSTLKMRTLLEDGRRNVLEGKTTPDEVLRVCQREELGIGNL
jgi:type II secretory ATPase GspE/PulE/Tfp pilus assembly ATPase PilB-like protein